MLTPETIDITIDSIGWLGDGIGRHNGKSVFVPKASVGDRLRVRLVQDRKEGYQADIESIISPGADRQEAPCPYFSRCGGCSLQQLIPDSYRGFKERMLQSAIERAGFSFNAQTVFLPPETRRRVEFKVVNGKLGFFAPRSHTGVIVDECMLLVPSLQAMIAPINQALRSELAFPQLFAIGLTQADRGVDMMLTFRASQLPPLPSFEALCAQLGVARISARVVDGKARVVTQVAPVEMVLIGDYAVALPPDAFLQATAQGQKLLTMAVLEGIQGEPKATNVVDLFCGIGTYSFPLSQRAHVHAVEGDRDMVATLKAAIKQHGIPTLTAEQRDLFKSPLLARDLAKFDAAVINPPRVGAKAQVEQLAVSGISKIVMVSCSPASFVRDAAILRKKGFAMQSAQGIDQFVWSQHFEITALFTR